DAHAYDQFSRQPQCLPERSSPAFRIDRRNLGASSPRFADPLPELVQPLPKMLIIAGAFVATVFGSGHFAAQIRGKPWALGPQSLECGGTLGSGIWPVKLGPSGPEAVKIRAL